MSIEQQARDIFAEANAQAKDGTLTSAGLQRAIAAAQEFIDFLDALLDSDLFISDAGTAGDAAATLITERLYHYD